MLRLLNKKWGFTCVFNRAISLSKLLPFQRDRLALRLHAQAHEAILVNAVQNAEQEEAAEAVKPPSLVKRRNHLDWNYQSLFAPNAVAVAGAHVQSVFARVEVGESDVGCSCLSPNPSILR